MIYLIAVLLIAVVALLWYAVRTHKTVSQLEAKLITSVGEAVAKVKSST